jgi:hypothetical protein
MFHGLKLMATEGAIKLSVVGEPVVTEPAGEVPKRETLHPQLHDELHALIAWTPLEKGAHPPILHPVGNVVLIVADEAAGTCLQHFLPVLDHTLMA